MPHALLTGDPRRLAAVRRRLEGLGLTSAAAEAAAGCDATVGACDLLVHAATARHADVPRRRAGEQPDAPLLCVGAPRPEAWRHLPWSELEGVSFARAVRACVDRARMLRAGPPSDDTARRYRELLAHELRSPLAVVAASLQALAADGADPEVRELVERARRNVARLERTLEWNHHLLLLAAAEPLPARVAVDVPDLAGRLAADGVVAACRGDAIVETDPDLVGAVVLQMVRACRCLGGAAPPHVALEAADGWLDVRVAHAAAAAPRVARVGPSTVHGAPAPTNLVDLVPLLVPAAALVALAARLDEAPDGSCVLRLPARGAVPAV